MFISSDFFYKDLEFGRNNCFCSLKGEKLCVSQSKSSLRKISEFFKRIPKIDFDCQSQFTTFIKNVGHLNDKIDHYNAKVQETWVHIVLNTLSFGLIDLRINRIDLSSKLEKAYLADKKIETELRGFIRRKRAQKNALMARPHLLKAANAFKISQIFLAYVNPVVYTRHSVKRLKTLSRTEFKQYQILKKIDEGTDGVVYLIKFKEEIKVLKLSLWIGHKESFHQDTALSITSFLIRRNLAPHLTHVYDTFRIFRRDAPPGFKKFNDMPFLKVQVMEAMESSLNKTIIYPSENKTFLVQLLFTQRLLQNVYQTFIDDIYSRNIFFKRLGPNDFFKRQRMIDFPYWKYTIAGISFYVPRPSILIKYGDYDRWHGNDYTYTDKDLFIPSVLQNMFIPQKYPDNLDYEIDKLAEHFKKPDVSPEEILDMGEVI